MNDDFRSPQDVSRLSAEIHEPHFSNASEASPLFLLRVLGAAVCSLSALYLFAATFLYDYGTQSSLSRLLNICVTFSGAAALRWRACATRAMYGSCVSDVTVRLADAATHGHLTWGAFASIGLALFEVGAIVVITMRYFDLLIQTT